MTAGAGLLDVTPLVTLLGDLAALQEELAVVLDAKLAAMRRADVAAMHSASAREGHLMGQAARLDAARHATVARVAAALGLPRGEPVTLTAVAARVDGAPRAALHVAGARLRDAMLRVAERNRVVSMVSGEMLAHFRSVFAAMARRPESPAEYTPRGGAAHGAECMALDAVG